MFSFVILDSDEGRGCIAGVVEAIRKERAKTMVGELLRIGSVFLFAVSLFGFREVFLSFQVGERRKVNGQRF